MAETLELIAAGLRSMAEAMEGMPGGADDRKLCDCDGYELLSTQARRAVSGANGYDHHAITTMGELMALSDDQLLDRKRLGRTALFQLNRFMETATEPRP
jgi:hypothetical protein